MLRPSTGSYRLLNCSDVYGADAASALDKGAGGTPQQLSGWQLTKPEDYHYLNTSGMIKVPQLDDKFEFEQQKQESEDVFLP